MKARWTWVLLFSLLIGCGGPTRVVRLNPDGGEPIIRPLPSRSTPVEVTADALSQALAMLVLDVPLSVRPAQTGRLLLASTSEEWGHVDRGLQSSLRKDYGRWCKQHEARGDCLSLLEDGLGFDDFDRLRISVAFALEPGWEGITEAVREVADARVLKAMIVSSMAAYVLLLAAPEPVITKGVTLVLTAYMVAYLGAGPFLDLVWACMNLRAETRQATTFTALEEAGARFGRVVGRNGARVTIMLVTAALGGKAAGLAARGPGLPGFVQAAAAAEADLGLVLPAVSGVRGIAVNGNGLVIGLAPGAVAMSVSSGGGRPPPGRYTTYRSVDASGRTQYAGLTNDLARRAAEHLRGKGIQIEKLLGNLSREDARAVEQALIELHGLRKNGGTLLNEINSIAPSNPKYADLLRRGLQLLESIGYNGG
ncbi:hypothetical protein [Pyxidicoccus caerfyrddinensis]|uniref:SitA5 family polymorphic toxin n=1 Tax=Pyxidicoccus caerfyrddinensis TaxID=2709663 RepID=UPI0013DC36ED|nr:hypothetical protein [Pyxidicoccus caerfyrddinensis]